MPKKTKINTDDIADAISDAADEVENLAGLKTKKKRLTMRSSIKAVAIKVYDEQIPKGWDDVSAKIKNINKNRKKNKWRVVAIRHDRDTLSNDIFLPSIEKPHYHIIMRLEDMKHDSTKVSTVLRALGIKFRSEDEMLWLNHGVELIVNFEIYVLYLLHQTQQAIKDGKAEYRISELVTNLKRTEIEKILGIARNAEKVKTTDAIEFELEARNIGYTLADFDEWYDELPFNIRTEANFKKYKRAYEHGIKDYLKIPINQCVNRLCVYIQGETNKGKTYAINMALAGKNVLKTAEQGTGKFDQLSPTTDAIFVDDDSIPGLLTICGDYKTALYRRNSDNRYWCGDTFIATSNDDFETWVRSCGYTTKINIGTTKEPEWIPTEKFLAVKNRLFVCHLANINDHSFLVVDSVPERGGKKVKEEKLRMFESFREKFNDVIATYTPSDFSLNADEMNLKAIKKMCKKEGIPAPKDKCEMMYILNKKYMESEN